MDFGALWSGQLLKQIQYEQWANEGLIDVLDALEVRGVLPERALLLMGHVVAVHELWMKRLGLLATEVQSFGALTLAQCREIHQKSIAKWQELCTAWSPEDWAQEVDFDLAVDGSRRRMHRVDGLYHILSHSAYHRGQIQIWIKPVCEVLPFHPYVFWAGERLDLASPET